MEAAPIVLLCTVPDQPTAERVGKGLVEARLAACVNVIPGLRSFYRWDGEVQDDAELLLVIKTVRSRYAEVEAFVAEAHPYDVPELIQLDVGGGSKAYLDWVVGSSTG